MKKSSPIASRLFTACVFVLLATLSLQADVTLPAIFSDNMVLQQGKKITIWGQADMNETVTVSIRGNRAFGKADFEGVFKVQLNPMEAGGPYALKIKGKNTITLKNVLIGEVWLCSGQSNMEMPMQGWRNEPIEGSKEAIAGADFPELRLFTVKKKTAAEPQEDCTGKWSVCTPETAAPFSATGFFFGRKLLKELDVPVGLIHSSWGGTPAQSWTTARYIRSIGDFGDKVRELRRKKESDKIHPHTPTSLYNGMINPLVPFTLRGAIWYQGESNTSNPKLYREIFPAMIKSWRDMFGQGNFPFYYVQIAPFKYGGNDNRGVKIREVQRETLSKVGKVGMAVLMDRTTLTGIHPPYKKEAGERLALWALKKDYKKTIVFSGPLYKAMEVDGSRVKVDFHQKGGGLTSLGKDLTGFEVAGADNVFHPAKAVIENDVIVLTSDKVAKPAAVQYGWSDTATATLFNKEGLPASSFRTSDW